VPSGALTAVAGLLLLRGQFLPGLSALDTQQQILAYALVLGYAQQLFTRLIDRRAQSILDGVPSKDSEATQPRPLPGRPTLDCDRGPSEPPPSATATAGNGASPAMGKPTTTSP